MRAMKAAAFDLDDTLLHNDLSISPYTVGVFRQLNQSGFSLIAASGRARLSMKPFVDFLNCTQVYIACNGAEIYDTVSDKLIHEESFGVELAREIAAFGEESHCYAQTYSGDTFFYNQHSVYADRYAASALLKGVYVGRLDRFISGPCNKILMMAEEDEIARMLEIARHRFEGRASVTCSKPWFLEFNPLKATKGNALSIAASHLRIRPDEIIAFGDSLNDLSMFQAAGFSVIVENGRNDIKPLCGGITGSNEDDGVAHWLADHYRSGEVLL